MHPIKSPMCAPHVPSTVLCVEGVRAGALLISHTLTQALLLSLQLQRAAKLRHCAVNLIHYPCVGCRRVLAARGRALAPVLLIPVVSRRQCEWNLLSNLPLEDLPFKGDRKASTTKY